MSSIEFVDNSALSVSDVEWPSQYAFRSASVWLSSFQTVAALKVSMVGERGGLAITRSICRLGIYASNCLQNKFCFGEGLRTPVHGWEGVAGGLYGEYNQPSRLSSGPT
jgi:hypothetical protein